jgi:LysM repeat protein
MTADANSAFGGRLRSQRTSTRQVEEWSRSGSQSNPPSLKDSYGVLPSSQETFSLETTKPFPSPISTQATAFHSLDSLDISPDVQTAYVPLALRVQQQVQALFNDQVTPVRLASHFAVLAVAAIVLLFGRVDSSSWTISLGALQNNALLGLAGTGGISSQVSVLLSERGAVVIAGNESLQRAIVPFTAPNARSEVAATDTAQQVQNYVVQPGDTVLAIAERFGLQPETVQWSNAGLLQNADLIRPGDVLNILPVDGLLHSVAPGDTLGAVASRYKVSIDDIVNFAANGFTDTSSTLTVGQQIVVPGGTRTAAAQQLVTYSGSREVPASAKVGSGSFEWPTSGSINQRYWSGHPGVDIGAWTGAPVKAVDGGYVVIARGGWNGGYGNHVIIDHGNGFVTLYAHLNSLYVKPGESVSRGQQVGTVGNTGNSTGPHLHFEIRYQGISRNPLNYLP